MIPGTQGVWYLVHGEEGADDEVAEAEAGEEVVGRSLHVLVAEHRGDDQDVTCKKLQNLHEFSLEEIKFPW